MNGKKSQNNKQRPKTNGQLAGDAVLAVALLAGGGE
jgi:hypothetical protein